MTVRLAKVLLLLFAWCDAGAHDAVDSRCSIELHAEDGRGAPLDRAEVVVRSPVLFEPRRDVTDPTGRLVILGLRPGVYEVEIGKVGYQWLEVEEVACPPRSSVQLRVTLEQTEYDEVVVLGAGPALDARSAALEETSPEAAWRDVPRSDLLWTAPLEVDGLAGRPGPPPRSAGAWSGLVDVATARERAAVTTRPLAGGFHGRVAVEVASGASAAEVSSRGSATTVDRIGRLEVSVGAEPGDGRFRWFLTGETERTRLEHRAQITGPGSSATSERSQDSAYEATAGLGAFRVALTPAHELDLRWYGNSDTGDHHPATLFVAEGSPVPTADLAAKDQRLRAALSGVFGSNLAYELVADLDTREETAAPLQRGLLGRDQTADGAYSAGLGNGIWYGSGGVPVVDDRRTQRRARGSLRWVATAHHTLNLAATWHEVERTVEMVPLSTGWDRGGLFATREVHEWSGTTRTISLAGPPVSTGHWRQAALDIGDQWYLAPSVVLDVGLSLRDVKFESDFESRGYDFGPTDTLSPRLSLVWDFEGNGRSRAWLAWRQWRPNLDEVVRYRLMGALEVQSELSDPEDGLSLRPPGALEVDPELEPARHEETMLGVEYELLSRLVVGGVVSHGQARDGVATLSTDGGSSFEVGSPRGDTWHDGLWSDRWDVRVWAKKHLSSGWQAEVTFGWSKLSGTWAEAAPFAPAEVDREWLRDVVVPASLVDASGPLPEDRRWHWRMLGSWTAANGVVVGGRLDCVSGAPVSRLGGLDGGFGLDRRFVEGRGSAGRTPSVWQLDGLVVWPFDLGSGVLEARMEVLNLLDRGTAYRFDERWSVLDENDAAGLDAGDQQSSSYWGRPLVVQRPLEVRIGLSYGW
jgi:hypothetical protein